MAMMRNCPQSGVESQGEYKAAYTGYRLAGHRHVSRSTICLSIDAQNEYAIIQFHGQRNLVRSSSS